MTGLTDRDHSPCEAQSPATAGVAGIHAFNAVAGDGAECWIVLDRKTLIIDRDIGGLNCRVSLPGIFYDSITLNILQPGYSVTLVNNDPALNLTVDCPDGLRSALDLRDSLARQLRLPALTQSRDGQISGKERKLGGILLREGNQRRGSHAIGRRPRFLARRRRGSSEVQDQVRGREIIARS